MDAAVSFSFGRNWVDYLDEGVEEKDIAKARADIEHWLGRDSVAGKSVVDIGCGSGIHALSFSQLGASKVVPFDYDPLSVEATRRSYGHALHGSILDQSFIGPLGQFDIVYSWGVLHHTGQMWEAVNNACSMVAPGGTLWIALYKKGPLYPKHLREKQRYNASGPLGKWLMERVEILRAMKRQIRRLENPFACPHPRFQVDADSLAGREGV